MLWCRFVVNVVFRDVSCSLSLLVEAWCLSPFFGRGVALWKLILFHILWSVWKERNERIFSRRTKTVEELLHLAILRISK